jgi:hypothetical protein
MSSTLDKGLDRLLLPRNPEARLRRIEAIIVERNELVAERDRLREALRQIASAGYVKTGSSSYEDKETGDPRMEALADIARAALAGSAPPPVKEDEHA